MKKFGLISQTQASQTSISKVPISQTSISRLSISKVSTSTTQVSNTPNPNPVLEVLTDSGLVDAFLSPLGATLLICIGGLVWANLSNGGLFGKGNRQKLARARWAGNKEKNAARQTACEQMEARKHNRVALYVSRSKVEKPLKIGDKYLIQIPKSRDRLYFPDAQRGVIVCGSPGSGKSYSLINPLLRSAIDQNFPIVLYDLKYSQLKSATFRAQGQTAKLAGYAIARGYEVVVVAPGFEGCCIVNLLDFLESETDVAMARQLAIVLNKNLKLGSGGDKGSNPFYTNARELLTQALFQLAKGTKYPDLLMCFAILSLDKLIVRLQNADLNPWTRAAFSQFLSVAHSPETAANIAGTTLGLFTRFIIPELLSTFCGTTNLPLDLKERQLVIFATDDEKRDVISPLIASVLHLIGTRNLATPRSTPFVLSLDELPTIYLPSLPSWLNQKRENGLVAILGLQNLSQLEETYGKEECETIFTGCGTKAFFNAGSAIAAERYSKYLGEEEVQNTRRNRKIDKKGGTTTDTSDDFNRRSLFEVAQFNTLPEGKAVIISPGFKSAQEATLPLLEKIKLSQKVEDELEAESIDIWYKYQQNLVEKSQIKTITEEDLRLRRREAQLLFPLPIKGQLQTSEERLTEM
jgi:type IV secretory pathway TraG/TraD family ATPase VirD4